MRRTVSTSSPTIILASEADVSCLEWGETTVSVSMPTVEEEAEPVEVDLPENVLGKQIRSQLQLRTLKKQQVRKSKSE